MDDYLSQKTSQEGFGKKEPGKEPSSNPSGGPGNAPFYKKVIKYFYRGPKRVEVVEEEIDSGVPDEQVEEMEKEFEEFEEKVEVEVAPRRGIISKLFSFLGSGDGREEISEEEYQEIESQEGQAPKPEMKELPEDVKEALKIQNRWLARLSPEHINEFRSSQDYENYKSILRKYNLIK
jgi:hypothetical protein